MKKTAGIGSADDIFLLKLIQTGNKQAFKHLFDSYFTPLCRFVRVYVHEGLAAEEIVSDVFVAVWEKKDQIEIQISWKSYLFQAARNRALNYLRDNERYVSVSDWSLYDRAETDNRVEMRELELLIMEAIDALPARTREIFTKSRIGHLTNKEIAAELDVTVKNVEAHITNAIKRIRKYLGDAYFYLFL